MPQQVAEQVPFKQYTANGLTTVFAYDFQVLVAADLNVYADGVLVPNSEYSLSGVGVQAGGNVTFSVAPASGVDVLLSREIALSRDTEYQTLGDFKAAVVNPDFNRLWMALQGQEAAQGGMVRAPYPEQLPDMPVAADRALKYLGFDAGGAPTVFPPTSGTAADVLIQLANSASAAQGDALVAVKSSLSGSAATTQHEVNERMRSVFDWLTTAEKAAVKAGTVLDITTNVQAAINSGESLVFPSGFYYVNVLTFSQVGKTYFFNGAKIVANDTGARKALIDLSGSDCNFYNLELFGNWKSNYTCLLYWHSASLALPAQANRFYSLALYNGLIGILFGEVSPTVAVDSPQSENFIYGFRSRGMERPIYMNQVNGFLQVNGEITSSKNEWDIVSPAVYSFAQSCPATVLLGVLRIHGEVIKADTQLGAAFRNSGGTLEVSGVIEAACQVFAGSGSGGYTSFHDVTFGYWGNASTSWAILAGTGGVLTIGNYLLNKAAGASGANTALVDLGGATGWEVSVSNSRLENQLNLVFSNGSGTPHMWSGDNVVTFDNVVSLPAGGGTTPTWARVSTQAYNLLDLRGTDVIGNDIATWYKRDVTGVGAIALNADIPGSSSYFNSMMVTPAVTTGRSAIYSIDPASLASVKATGIKCRPGEKYMLSGWFRMTTSGTGEVSALFCNTSGTIQVAQALITQAQLLTSAWRYLTVMFTVPANSAYFGVGMDCYSGTIGRMAGLKVARLGNET